MCDHRIVEFSCPNIFNDIRPKLAAILKKSPYHYDSVKTGKESVTKQAIPTTAKRVLNEHEAADWLGLDVTTMRDWRFHRRGPVYEKYLGRAVRYPVEELLKFAERSRIQTAA